MSIARIVTRGFGNGTFSGTIKDVVLRGYAIGGVIPPTPTPTQPLDNHTGTAGGADVVIKLNDKMYLKVQRDILLQEEDDLMDILQIILLSGILEN